MTRRRLRKANPAISYFVNSLGEMGPTIPEIARKMHWHRETVRYWYKRLIKRGFAVQASVNFEKLGLKRVVAVVRFDHQYRGYSEPILTAMSKLCYVQSFVRTLPSGDYIVHGAVPEEFLAQWMEFFGGLKEGGLFTSVEFSTYDWVRNVPMKTEFYNFDEEIWEFGWSIPRKVYPEMIQEPSTREQFDRTDLEIIKRLQVDANKSLSEIQKEVGVNYKTLSFHYRNHVLARRLLKGYKINWMGTRYSYGADRVEHRRHKYQPIDIIVKDIDEEGKAELIGMTNALPYLWWEASGLSYYAQLAFPTENIAEAMEFLSTALSPFGENADWYMVDQTHSLAFTIPPELFDPETRSWKFDQEGLQSKFEQLILQIKRGRSSDRRRS